MDVPSAARPRATLEEIPRIVLEDIHVQDVIGVANRGRLLDALPNGGRAAELCVHEGWQIAYLTADHTETVSFCLKRLD
ncbi:MAG: hypothetical protein AAF871_08575 [Pseudomonadota bacterium]